MNEAIISKTVAMLQQIPYEIRDVLLMVNTRDLAQRVYAGSCFIGVFETPEFSASEKAILLAEFMKRLNIRAEDLTEFMRT